jgi:hypothetical protein
MSPARPKQRPATRVAAVVAASALEGWVVPTALGAIVLAAAAATALGAVNPAGGLAVTIAGTLAFVAERALARATAANGPGIAAVLGIAVAWVALCYAPFHPILFPGPPLHAPVTLHAGDATLPVAIPTGGHHAVDLVLEGRLPPNPSGGPAIPVQYALTVEAGTSRDVLAGRFDETLRTQRLGRRGTATVVQAHHTERRVVANPSGGELRITGVSLEPAEGATVTVTAHAHALPATPVLVVAALLLMSAAVIVDTRLVPASAGTLVLATPAALGTALALWTSNTVHPTLGSIVGATIFGGPVGLAVGALVWAIARRTLVGARR